LAAIRWETALKRYAPRGSTTALATQLRRLLPEAEIRVQDGQIVLEGRAQDHEKLERLLLGQTVRTEKPATKSSEKLFTLRATGQPAGAVVRQVAQSLGKEFRYDEALREKLQQPVTLDLKNATTAFLLENTLEPLGLRFQITDKEVIVLPGR
jgi:hypothetical protein